MLNYIYLHKELRSNSFIENYNRRIRQKLGPLLKRKGDNIVNVFFSFIINEENYYKKKVISMLEEDSKNKFSIDVNDINLKDIDKNKEELLSINTKCYNVRYNSQKY